MPEKNGPFKTYSVRYGLAILLTLGVGNGAFAQADMEDLVSFSSAQVSLARPGSVPGTSTRTINQVITINGFAIGRTEVTQESFERVMGHNPSHRAGPKLPVTNVSWRDALEYCNRRSALEGLAPVCDLDTNQCDFRKTGYRLPTEAEWLHAAETSVIPGNRLDLANLGSKNTKSVTELRQEMATRTEKPVGSYAPNARGLYDMLGNIWEWTYDYFNTQTALITSTEFPTGPSQGVERVILGGSYRSGFWGRKGSTVAARDFRRGSPPTMRSRYTGFRICRSIPNPNYLSLRSASLERWLRQFQQPPDGFRDELGGLAPLAPDGESVQEWRARRVQIKAKWERILGHPSLSAPLRPETRLLRAVDEDFYTGQLMELRTEPDRWEKVYLMVPKKPVRRPMPAVITPYYDVDTPAGKNLGGHLFSTSYVRHFGEELVRRGFVVLAIRCWDESYGEDEAEAVSNLYERHPAWTGLGKWVWDSGRALDYLATVDGVDMKRVGMIGHSLGGKMTLYAAAMDPRIAVAVSSEPGIGVRFSNYDDYWYLSTELVERPREPFDQHELLALIAPRPFLLIGGDSADGDKSWYYINAAKAVYKNLGRIERLGYYNHRRGHSPTPEAYELSLEWLEHFLLNGG